MEMEAALAAADGFRIDDASCAVTQFWAWTHTFYKLQIATCTVTIFEKFVLSLKHRYIH